MLSVKQAAERARVSESLIYRWCAERRLRHYRLGGNGRRGRIRAAKRRARSIGYRRQRSWRPYEA